MRRLHQSRVGAVLTHEREALAGGGPVKALFIQNTNPMVVAPDQEKVRRGFAREDLFTVVHEQFLTDTARMADIVLPATMFMEHDDLYTASAHQYLQFAGKLIEPPPGCRSNHEVICELARRLGAEHRGFAMTPREIIDETLRVSGRGTLAEMEAGRWLDCRPAFDEAHYLDGFAHTDGKFHFRADWATTPYANNGLKGDWASDAVAARPLAGQRGERAANSRSSSRPRRRATSSIRASTEPRLRARARRGRRRCCIPTTRRALASPTATSCGSATGAARCGCTPSSRRRCARA